MKDDELQNWIDQRTINDQQRLEEFNEIKQLLNKRIDNGDTELINVLKMLDSLRAFVIVNPINLCFAESEEFEIELEKINLSGYLP